MSEIPAEFKEYFDNLVNEQVTNPARILALIEYCLTIPCPNCHAPQGERCNGNGAHAGRISLYIATEAATVFCACQGIG